MDRQMEGLGWKTGKRRLVEVGGQEFGDGRDAVVREMGVVVRRIRMAEGACAREVGRVLRQPGFRFTLLGRSVRSKSAPSGN